METILVGKRPPSATTKKRKTPMKAKSSRFDSLVARYYPAIYSFASRLTDDPRKANALTRNAFRSAQKQLCSLRDQTAVATILISAVIRVGPGRGLICAAAGSGDRHVT
jgi:DNA-directed RNA polymerase specialized sigma24 family protein